ncbi:MAG: hypothetical protein E7071_08910 [Bacteroidales bacterium]|nr:hypothetical protein [Bacteroidales bacterium]
MRFNILGASLLAAILVACSDISSGVTVDVRVEGSGVNAPAKLEFADTTYVASLNMRGSGSFELNGGEGYGVLDYNGCRLPVYVGNDDFTISLLVNGSSMRPSFSGKGGKLNYYMSNTRRATPDYDLEEREYMTQLKKNLATAEQRLAEMNFDEKFSELERVRIRYDYLGTLPGYPVYHSMQTGHNDTLSDEYYKELYSLLQGDEKWLELREFRNALQVAVNRIALKGTNRTDTSAFIISQLEIIKHSITSPKVASYVASAMAVRYINDRGIDELSHYESLCNALITEQSDKVEYQNALAKWQKIAKGVQAPDFAGLTSKGGLPIKWERMKGKSVYILCWLAASDASIDEVRALQKYIKKYAKTPIEFVMIAGDGSAQYWDKVLEKNRFAGTQVLAASNRDFLDAMSVQLFPRAILVDSDGKIISAVAPLPSSPKLPSLLDELAAK